MRNAIQHKLGTLERRLPITGWDEVHIDPEIVNNWRERCGSFLFSSADRGAYAPILRCFDDASFDWGARVEQVAAGKLSYFSNEPVEAGFPPRWNDNLLEGRSGPPLVHFSKIDEFGCGDVKCIWEPSRFGFAYDLVRAYWRTGNERAAEVFWTLAEDWLEHNPPNRGVNWKCGQESTFRAMAWCFALWGFADCSATTPERVLKAIRLGHATGRRVEAHLGYALSQRNNHGISEAMGLFTIGLLFPFFEESKRWATLGRKHLESQARTLIYDDGGFAQHSANYHRVMLHDYLYAIRIGELNDAPLSGALRKCVARAGTFLDSITDRATGCCPRYGQDDGAHVLPLANTAYDDVRPVVQATAAVCGDGELPFEHGVWDELSFWLCGDEPIQRGVSDETGLEDVNNWAAGCDAFHNKHGMAMLRAQRYKHRPSQLDQLHVDIRWKGVNVALDPGTYSYNAENEWAGIPLSKTAAHNTVMVEGKEQAEQAGSRFIFLPWPQVRRGVFDLLSQSEDHSVGMIAMRGPDRRHHRQLIRLGDEVFVVLDDLGVSADALPSTLHWHLADAPYVFDASTGRLELDYEPGRYRAFFGVLDGGLSFDLERAVEGSYVGWYAPRYMLAEPALWLTAATGPGPSRLFSVFGPDGLHVQPADSGLRIVFNNRSITLTAEDWPASMGGPNDAVDRYAKQWSR